MDIGGRQHKNRVRAVKLTENSVSDTNKKSGHFDWDYECRSKNVIIKIKGFPLQKTTFIEGTGSLITGTLDLGNVLRKTVEHSDGTELVTARS